MKRLRLKPMFLVATLAVCNAVFAEDSGPCGISSKILDDGSVELATTENSAKCETSAGAANSHSSGPAPSEPSIPTGTVPPTPSAPTPLPAAEGQGTSSASAKTPQEQYRDTIIQGSQGAAAANPAVSRRYKMMNKETYQATFPDGAQSGNSTAQ